MATTSPNFGRQRPRAAPRTEPERQLPQNTEAERDILGAILLDNTALTTAGALLKPNDFAREEHQYLFRRMVIMFASKEAIDWLTLVDALQKRGELEKAGGAAYVSDLMADRQAVTNVEHHCRIVKEKSERRGWINGAHAIEELAFDPTADSSTIRDRAGELFTGLHGNSPAAGKELTIYTAQQVVELVPEPIEWFAYPIAAKGMTATIDGPAKLSGKTTLILAAVNAMLRRRLFLNRATRDVPVLFVTEENRRTFRLALERAGLTDLTDLHVLFAGSAGLPWPRLAQFIERKCDELKIGWLVLDTFFAIAGLGGETENQAGSVDEAFLPIRHIAAKDVAVTLSRHTRKSGGQVGESARGSSALSGAVDIITELKRPAGNGWPGVRSLEITGRIDQAQLEIELRDGIYSVVSTEEDRESSKRRDDTELLRSIIGKQPGLSQNKIVEASGLRRGDACELLTRHAGEFWRTEIGARNALLYYPI